MFRMIRLSLLAAATTALVACGGGAKLGGGKEGAAQALFQAGQPAGKGGNSSGQSLLTRMANAAATGSAEISVDCEKGGSAKLTLNVTSGNQTGTVSYNVQYNDCSQDGVNTFDGSMAMDLSLTGIAPTIEMALHLKGKINIDGDINDFIDADVTETVSATATSATSGTVTIKLNGSIKTSEGNYTYANESLTITAGGSLPEDGGNS